MKTFTLLFFFLTVTLNALTQINKGQFLLGGNVSYESTTNKSSNNVNYKLSTFSISPDVGYFIINKLAGGLRLEFRSFKQTSTNYKSTFNSTSIAPFLRYYFLKPTSKLNILADVSYISYRNKYGTSPNPTSIERINGIGIAAGPAVFLTEQIALEFTLAYKHTKIKDVYESKSDIFSTGIGFQIHLGKSKKSKS
jgi:Outer membrane protein beta-barrel domain